MILPKRLGWLTSGMTMLLMTTATSAAELTPRDEPLATYETDVLTLSFDDRKIQLSLADIEQLDLYDTHLRHPEGPEGKYTGVKLTDFLAAYDLEEAERLRFTALDDYSIFLDPDDVSGKEYLLATRFSDDPIAYQDKGPLMLMVPADEEAVLNGEEPMAKWIWALHSISVP
ncbi:hypothetical protein [Aidingimonas lacisalsi]|uniref:hypothetical protein n=1 Tax=Aidingimonas lacisalsi TaxID=2604086 RepID=UPI0011D1EB1B|nr:hypothetical protein [Aidingimonas lacisalsi]